MNSTCKQTLKRSHMNDQQLYKEMFHVIQEDLSVFLRIHIKSRVQWCVPIIPRVHGNGRFPGAYWPASLIKLVNSRFSERLWLKTKIVKGTDVNLWPPHSGRHTRMQTCTHMNTYPYKTSNCCMVQQPQCWVRVKRKSICTSKRLLHSHIYDSSIHGHKEIETT